jgi:DNA mismatch repair protein MSH6
MNIECINERLDAVEELQRFSSEREEFMAQIKKFPDLERMCGRIYKYSVLTNAKKKAVYFEDISTQRLKEFKSLTSFLQEGEKLLMRTLASRLSDMRSKRLIKLLTFKKSVQKQKTENVEAEGTQGAPLKDFIYQDAQEQQ